MGGLWGLAAMSLQASEIFEQSIGLLLCLTSLVICMDCRGILVKSAVQVCGRESTILQAPISVDPKGSKYIIFQCLFSGSYQLQPGLWGVFGFEVLGILGP